MSVDNLRAMKSIGRDLTGESALSFKTENLPERVCFAIPTPRSLLDTSAYADAFKAGKQFKRADFTFYFLPNPAYPDFCQWIEFFLEHTKDHLAIVLSGYSMQLPDGIQTEAHPFTIKGREVLPSRFFSLIKKHKNEAARLTIVINGCPSIETWSNAGEGIQSKSFTLSSVSNKNWGVMEFQGEVPARVLLLTACPKLDAQRLNTNGKLNISTFIHDLMKLLKKDPVLSAETIYPTLQKSCRANGQELIVYSSSYDATSSPVLL